MKELELQNCYELYKEKFGESIQGQLEQTISESQKEINLKIEAFVKKHFQDPVPVENTNTNADTREKRILRDIIHSKNILLGFLPSPYIHLYIQCQEDIPELARRIAWNWLSHPKAEIPMPAQLKFKTLKEMIVEIGYHSSIYYWNDRFLSILKENDPTVSWPEKEHLEIHQIKLLEEKIIHRETQYKALELNENKWYEKQKEIISELQVELDNKKDQLSLSKAKLDLLEGPYFFHEDNLYKNYVFGDILPELKSVYNLLKEYKLYESNWGYFCYCMTWYNTASKNSPNQRLILNLQNSEFSANDLGYILDILKKHYSYESQLPFIQWVIKNIEIISGHGKTFTTEEDYRKFNEKSIRSYKTGKSRPNFYDEINQSLQALLL